MTFDNESERDRLTNDFIALRQERQCITGKVCYPDEDTAAAFAERMAVLGMTRYYHRPYKCPACHWFHTTTRGKEPIDGTRSNEYEYAPIVKIRAVNSVVADGLSIAISADLHEASRASVHKWVRMCEDDDGGQLAVWAIEQTLHQSPFFRMVRLPDGQRAWVVIRPCLEEEE